jgi:hypothetical protein
MNVCVCVCVYVSVWCESVCACLVRLSDLIIGDVCVCVCVCVCVSVPNVFLMCS